MTTYRVRVVHKGRTSWKRAPGNRGVAIYVDRTSAEAIARLARIDYPDATVTVVPSVDREPSPHDYYIVEKS